MVIKNEMWTKLGPLIGSVMFLRAIFRRYLHNHFHGYIKTYIQKVVSYVYPYVQIKFREHVGENLKSSEAYAVIESYLSAKFYKQAKMLKGDIIKDSKSIPLSLDETEEVVDEFEGVKLWWTSKQEGSKRRSDPYCEKRYYELTFHKRHREIITTSYLNHIVKQGRAVASERRELKLYTNNSGWHRYEGSRWSHVAFEHPTTFDTLALESKKKEEIINDLVKFSQARDYYAKIGKAWKRGYLLYGPPGTGKSSMIAAMANFLKYDIYDLELTMVKDNTELRKLLLETSSRSIIVIEDIDCSLDLTGQRRKRKEKVKDEEIMNDLIRKKARGEEEETNKVTLSGLLNSTDGLWSACGGERIMVFTTNYVDKLDPALIRRGRMDKHIELSYCCFEAFKILAKNYLDIESHKLFDTIGCLLGETCMTPADVAEILMPKSLTEDAETLLKNLIEALETAKEEARKKAEDEEVRLMKMEVEEKEKEQSAQEDVRVGETSANEVKENGVADVKRD